MATFLYKLGRLAFRRRWLMALLWVVIFCGAGFAASSAPAPPADTFSMPGTESHPAPPADTFSMPGTESQKAFDLLEKKFPDASADGASARVVVRAPEGEKISAPAQKGHVAALVAQLKKSPQVASVSDPFTTKAVSKDRSTAYAIATYKVPATKVGDKAHDALDDALAKARDGGLTAEAGGDAVKIEAAMGGTGEKIGIVVSAVVLVLTF
ncbi:MMPL family transporter, partial [Streptomyces sp. NPDC055287]